MISKAVELVAATYAILETETKSIKTSISFPQKLGLRTCHKLHTTTTTHMNTIVILSKSCFVGKWQVRIGVVSDDKQKDRQE